MTMNIALVLSVLCSGFPYFALSSKRLQFLNDTYKDPVKINETSHCRIVTLYDEDDVKVLNKFLQTKNKDGNIWLGLRRKENNFTTWSDGKKVQEQVNVSSMNQTCGASKNNTLTLSPCFEKMSFMCYKGNNYTLIEEPKANWCQALQYCRRHFTDLASISNDVIKEGKNTSFWTGLMHDEWEWMDGSCSTFRKWNPSQPENNEKHKQAVLSLAGSMSTSDSDSVATAICSNGTMRITVINETRNWEGAFNYCKYNHTGQLWIENTEDQEAVQQRLNCTDDKGPFWIGLRQSRIFGMWTWSDRTVGYSNWNNNQQPEGPLSNYCGVIHKNGTWSDEDCFRQLGFICEEEIVLM